MYKDWSFVWINHYFLNHPTFRSPEGSKASNQAAHVATHRSVRRLRSCHLLNANPITPNANEGSRNVEDVPTYVYTHFYHANGHSIYIIRSHSVHHYYKYLQIIFPTHLLASSRKSPLNKRLQLSALLCSQYGLKPAESTGLAEKLLSKESHLSNTFEIQVSCTLAEQVPTAMCRALLHKISSQKGFLNMRERLLTS